MYGLFHVLLRTCKCLFLVSQVRSCKWDEILSQVGALGIN